MEAYHHRPSSFFSLIHRYAPPALASNGLMMIMRQYVYRPRVLRQRIVPRSQAPRKARRLREEEAMQVWLLLLHILVILGSGQLLQHFAWGQRADLHSPDQQILPVLYHPCSPKQLVPLLAFAEGPLATLPREAKSLLSGADLQRRVCVPEGPMGGPLAEGPSASRHPVEVPERQGAAQLAASVPARPVVAARQAALGSEASRRSTEAPPAAAWEEVASWSATAAV